MALWFPLSRLLAFFFVLARHFTRPQLIAPARSDAVSDLRKVHLALVAGRGAGGA